MIYNMKNVFRIAAVLCHGLLHLARAQVQRVCAHLAVFKVRQHIGVFQPRLVCPAVKQKQKQHDEQNRNAEVDQKIANDFFVVAVQVPTSRKSNWIQSVSLNRNRNFFIKTEA